MTPKYFDVSLECKKCKRMNKSKVCVFYFRTIINIGCKFCRNCATVFLPTILGSRSTISESDIRVEIVKTY